MKATPLLRRAAIGAICLTVLPLHAQSYTIDWHKIQGGGGTSSNAYYQITGTIGQADASGVLTGGGYSLAGGYVEAIAPVQSTYAAGPGGTISGMGSQLVNYGFSGNPVTAVPSPGYYFVSWSDGVTTPTRTDLNETSNLSVTAVFAFNADVPLLAPWQVAGMAAALLAFGSRRA
jgi:Divergent InlB B-repeat domain